METAVTAYLLLEKAVDLYGVAGIFSTEEKLRDYVALEHRINPIYIVPCTVDHPEKDGFRDVEALEWGGQTRPAKPEP